MNKYIIRKAKLSDAKNLLSIRNQNHVRKNFIHSGLIDYPQHLVWYNNFLSNPRNYYYLIEICKNKQAKVVIGYCRYKLVKDKYDVSIAIDKKFLNQSIGKLLLHTTLKKVLKEKNPIIAVIKKNNYQSLKLFQKNKFVIISSGSRYYYLSIKN